MGVFANFLNMFCGGSIMAISEEKSIFICNGISEENSVLISSMLPYRMDSIDIWCKYLGF